MRSKRTLAIILLTLFLLFFPTVWITYREMRQATLDHALIEAIKTRDDKKTLALLAEGASGEARENEKPLTFNEALLQLFNHFHHTGTPFVNPADEDEHRSALIVFYEPSHFVNPDNPVPIEKHDPVVVRALLDHGAHINDSDSSETTALLYAARFSEDDNIRLLLSRGANIEAQDDHGNRPLMGADAGVTKILLEHGADIEARGYANRTPLMYAASEQQPEVVKILLEHGARVSKKDDGKTALDYIKDQDDLESRKIAALLRKFGAK